MINQIQPKEDKYAVLNDLTKVIKAKETDNKKNKKDKNDKHANVTIENLNEPINIDKQDLKVFNAIIVHTEKDNLVHNYFYDFNMYWDAGDCMSSVTLKFPKTETKNLQYWIKYNGEISMYMANKKDVKTTNQPSTKKKKAQDTYWSLKGMTPFFRGTIGTTKEKSETFEVRVDSIGKRFKQKIPEEFRTQYIYNQNVRDTFQAICQFLGVKYICPPASAKTNDTSTDGSENDVNSQQNKTQNAKTSALGTASDIIKTTKNIIQHASEIAKKSQNNNNNENETMEQNGGQQNNNTNNTNNTSTPVDIPINGYTDISFDANGNIVHGSTQINETPNMAETLIDLQEHPLEKYLDDTTNVSKDVTSLLEGRFFDTVHNYVMNYGSITIEPKDTSTTTPGSPTDLNTDPNADPNNPNTENTEVNSIISNIITKAKKYVNVEKIQQEAKEKAKDPKYQKKIQDFSKKWNNSSKSQRMQMVKNMGWGG